MMQMGEVDFGNPNDNGLVDNELFDTGTLFMGTSGGMSTGLGNAGTWRGRWHFHPALPRLQENQASPAMR